MCAIVFHINHSPTQFIIMIIIKTNNSNDNEECAQHRESFFAKVSHFYNGIPDILVLNMSTNHNSSRTREVAATKEKPIRKEYFLKLILSLYNTAIFQPFVWWHYW